MQSTVWKLTAMAGVIGIGLLVVLQAQHGMSGPESADDAGLEQLSIDLGVDPTEERGGASRNRPPTANAASDVNDPPDEQVDENLFTDPKPFAEFENAPTDPAASTDRSPTALANPIESDHPFALTADDESQPGPVERPAAPLPNSFDDSDPFGDAPQRQPGTTAADPNPFGGLEFDESGGPGANVSETERNSVPVAGPDSGDAASAADDVPLLAPPQLAEPADDPFADPFPDDRSAEPLSEPERPLASGPDEEPFNPFATAETETDESATPEPTRSADEPVEDFNPFATSIDPDPATPVERADTEPAPTLPVLLPAEPSPAEIADETAATADPRPVPQPRELFAGDASSELETAPEAQPSDPARLRERPAPPRLNLSAGDPPKPLEPAEETPSPVAPVDFHGDGVVTGDAPRGPQQPQLKIEKVAPPNAVIGQRMIYSIVIKNVGGSAARQVVVEDRIPKGTQLDGTKPQAEMVEKRLVWRIGTLEPQEERKISVRVIPLAEGQIGSVATVNFVAEVAAETLVTAPRLEIGLSGPKQARVGDTVEFKFKVTNDGNGRANGVVIRNLIPQGLAHPAGNDLEYTVGALPAGESREIALAVNAVKPGTLINRATVSADGDVTASAESTLEVIAEQIAIERTGPGRALVGRPAKFTNTVTNNSAAAVPSVTVTEVVPSGFEFAEASDGGQFLPATRTVTWQLGPLPPNGSRPLQLTLKAKTPGTTESEITVTGANGSVAQVSSQTTIEGYAALVVEPISESRPVLVGEQLTSKIKLTNRGSAAATNVVLAIGIPAELTVVSAQGPGEPAALAEGTIVQFDGIGSVPPQESVEIELVTRAVSAGTSQIAITLDADYLQQPLQRDEPVQIFPANP